MTIYVIPTKVKDRLPLAMNSNNIIGGFKVTSICHLNRNIFPDSAFVPDRLKLQMLLYSKVKKTLHLIAKTPNCDLFAAGYKRY